MNGSIHLFERLPQMEDANSDQSHSWTPKIVRSKPLVGLIRNLRSHHNVRNTVPMVEREDILVAHPDNRSDLPKIMAEFARKQVDIIAIDGGDGTVRDVLTCGAGAFGDNWPDLIVLPAGKTNALANDLGIPKGWSLDEALAAAKSGSLISRPPLVVSQFDDERAQVRGFVMGGGAFTRSISLGQQSHNLGAFNAAVVGLTTAWSFAQALFGRASNPWRSGTTMRLRDLINGDIPHSGRLPSSERFVIFASTLERFPAGLDPFCGVKAPLKMTLIDHPSRRLLFKLGAILFGKKGDATKLRGYHSFGTEGIELEIGGSFILDGEAFPKGKYVISPGQALRFVVP